MRFRRVRRRKGAAGGEAIYALVVLVGLSLQCAMIAIAFVANLVMTSIRARQARLAADRFPPSYLSATRPIPTHPGNSHQIGKQFELECAQGLIRAGWLVRQVGGSGDKGADLIGSRRGSVLVVQCKCYAQAVGTRAVQEAHTAGAYHGAHLTAVVAKNGFTAAAKQIAGKVGVRLINVSELAGL